MTDARPQRCSRCRMLPWHCFCDRLRPIPVSTRVVVVMHQRELAKVTNSGRLVALALQDARLVLHGQPGPPTRVDGLADPARRACVLFPADDAPPLSREDAQADGRPLTLVVPDGTWRQAQRMVRRIPALAALPRRSLPPGPPSRYRLRSAAPGRLSTCEAVSRALALIEGPGPADALSELFDVLVSAALAARAGEGPR